MSHSKHQSSEIQDLKSQISNLQRLRGDAAEARDVVRAKVLRLEFDLAEMTKDRNHWKASHDNQRNLKAAIIDRLDCGDRARKVVALFDKIHNLELALSEIAFGVKRPSERPSGCVTRELTKEDMQKIAEAALKI